MEKDRQDAADDAKALRRKYDAERADVLRRVQDLETKALAAEQKASKMEVFSGHAMVLEKKVADVEAAVQKMASAVHTAQGGVKVAQAATSVQACPSRAADERRNAKGARHA